MAYKQGINHNGTGQSRNLEKNVVVVAVVAVDDDDVDGVFALDKDVPTVVLVVTDDEEFLVVSGWHMVMVGLLVQMERFECVWSLVPILLLCSLCVFNKLFCVKSLRRTGVCFV